MKHRTALRAVAWSLCLAALAPRGALAQVADAGSSDASVTRVLRVAVAGSEPFVVAPEAPGLPPRGLSIEVWRRVAEHNHWAYAFQRVDTTEQLLTMVASGEVDVGVGPTSITAERALRVAFSQPYQDASLAILSPVERRYTDKLRPLLSRAFGVGGASLALALLSVGVLLWLAERRRNTAQFPAAPLAGIGNGMWLALVTMTTVGYGDRAPVTPLGRFVAGFWMIAALVITSSLTASLTTTLTLSQLDPAAVVHADALQGQRVGAVRGTTSVRFASRRGALAVPFASLDLAARALMRREVVAVVFDRPALQHYLHQHIEVPLQLSDASYEPQGYGFAMQMGSPLRVPVDVALLSMRQEGTIAAIAASWLGD